VSTNKTPDLTVSERLIVSLLRSNPGQSTPSYWSTAAKNIEATCWVISVCLA
jgi:hypothetical protein